MKFRKVVTLGLGLYTLASLTACGPTGGDSAVELAEPQPAKPSQQTGLVNLNGRWRQASFVNHGNYALVSDHIRVPAGKYVVTGQIDTNSMGLLARSTNGRTIDQSSIWPNRRIPYVLRGDLDPRAVAAVKAAMAIYNEKTPVSFEPKNQNDRNYVEVFHDSDSGCATANWGYSPTQSDNVLIISKADACLNDARVTGLIMHELAHTLGMEHEWARPDRDSHINIDLSNMIAGYNNPASDNFPLYKETSGITIGSFDFDSITMYGPFIFSLAKEKHKPVITRKQTNRPDFLGTHTLSRKDKRAIAILYASQGAPLIEPQNPNGIPDVTWRDRSQINKIDFTIQNIPDCSFVVAPSPHRVVQKSGSECSLVLNSNTVTWWRPGYYDITLSAFKEKKEKCTDVMKRSRRRVTWQKKCEVVPAGQKSEETFTITWKTPNQKPHLLEITDATQVNNDGNKILFSKDLPAQRQLLRIKPHDQDVGDKFFYSLSGADANNFVMLGNMLVSTAALTKPSYQIIITGEDQQKNTTSKTIELVSSGGTCSEEVSDRIRNEMNLHITSVHSERFRNENSLKKLESDFRNNHELSLKLRIERDTLAILESKLRSLSNVPAATHACENDWKVRYFEIRRFFDNPPKVQCDKARKYANDPNAAARINSMVESYRKEQSVVLTWAPKGSRDYNLLASALEKQVAEYRARLEGTHTHFKNSFPVWDADFKARNDEISAKNTQIQGSKSDVENQIKQKKDEIASLESTASARIQADLDANAEIKSAKQALEEAATKSNDQSIRGVEADKLKAAGCSVLAQPKRVPPVRFTL